MAGRGRKFGHNSLLVLQYFLENVDEPHFGSEITKATRVGPGSLYPILEVLEGRGWLEAAWEDVDPSIVGRPRRRLYRITGVGEVAGAAAIRAAMSPFMGRLRTKPADGVS